tara:strand:+ start:3793 stop:4938 length:1146 start_codon:yes stop_codon:yes gene_type:complete
MSKDLVSFVRKLYKTKEYIPLHEPHLDETDKTQLIKTIDSTFVSSVGTLVNEFEKKVSEFTGSKYAIAVVNGTAALHLSLDIIGVKEGDEVLTQSLNFVASTNAIHQCNASPVFIDVEKETLGMSPDSLNAFLENECILSEQGCVNKKTKKIVKACIAMHTFGFPCNIRKIKEICSKYNIKVIEDAAESLGSFLGKKHTGTYGDLGVFSFNGNKIITTGAGGMIVTNNKDLARLAKHKSTTARLEDKWNFVHDMPAFNYRLPNLNAALGISQLNKLPLLLQKKRKVAMEYFNWGNENGYRFKLESTGSTSNYWLNTLITKDSNERDSILEITNSSGVMTRPVWIPMHKLKFNQSYQSVNLTNTNWLSERIVNLPSSAPIDA